MSTVTRTFSAALVLTLGGVLAPIPSDAAPGEPPCMPVREPLSFTTHPPLRPGTTSSITFLVPGAGPGRPVEQRTASRPDGSEAHQVTVVGADGTYGQLWVANDTYPYTLQDIGTWILHDVAGSPLWRYTAKAASRFVSVTGPGRIVTAGETVTIRTRLLGWTAAGREAPVHGMPIDVQAQYPGGTQDWYRTSSTSAAGVSSLSFRADSNRDLQAIARPFGCYTHAGGTAPVLRLLVRKRITATPTTTTGAVGQPVRISGGVYPVAQNQPVYLQRWNGSAFVTVTPGRTNGAYVFYYRPPTRGTHVLRVYTPFDSWHVSSGSPNIQLTVR